MKESQVRYPREVVAVTQQTLKEYDFNPERAFGAAKWIIWADPAMKELMLNVLCVALIEVAHFQLREKQRGSGSRKIWTNLRGLAVSGCASLRLAGGAAAPIGIRSNFGEPIHSLRFRALQLGISESAAKDDGRSVHRIASGSCPRTAEANMTQENDPGVQFLVSSPERLKRRGFFRHLDVIVANRGESSSPSERFARSPPRH